MNNVIATNVHTVVIGLGLTGMSVVRFLRSKGRSVVAVDTRKAPKTLTSFKTEFPEVSVELGELRTELLLGASRIVISPGVSLKEPAVQEAIQKGIPVIGDIQLFLENIDSPVIAITGSNAKSTVTTLVGKMVAAAGIDVGVGGNIGTPVLDFLGAGVQKQIFVLELSSFQLESIEKLNAEVACVLNISADHMDRYEGLPEYHAAKQRIFYGAKNAVVNRDDLLTNPPMRPDLKVMSFGLDKPDLKQFGVINDDGEMYLAYGFEKLLNAAELKMVGTHNVANALAALAIGTFIGLSRDKMIAVLKEFRGLAHRCEWVATIADVDYINDSKGTNVGATIAAINGLSRLPKKLVLIAGGDGKEADFNALVEPMRLNLRSLIYIGKDGPKIHFLATQCGIPSFLAESMGDAVRIASQQAVAGDAVLLSPACASLDMYTSYVHRGAEFVAAVEDLAA